MSSRVSAGGKTPRDRIESRTFLSREVVHVRPSNVNPSIFGDLYSASQTIHSRVLANVGGNRQLVESHYAVDAANAMQQCLQSCGLDTNMYANEVMRLRNVRMRDVRARSVLLLMLFCFTGCLADGRLAAERVEEFSRHMLAQDLSTVSVSTDYASQRGSSLGLLRIVGNVVQPPILPLDRQGTVIGALPVGAHVIANVGSDVSRMHARIWSEDGRWLVEGLGSTNGTYLVSASDGSTLCVEPPRANRKRGVTYPPTELYEGDVLKLGKSTSYLILRVQS